MLLEIISPDKNIFSGEIELVQLPGSTGFFEILNNHAPLISTLKKGQIKVIDNQKQTTFYDINGGVVEVLKNKTVVLAE